MVTLLGDRVLQSIPYKLGGVAAAWYLCAYLLCRPKAPLTYTALYTYTPIHPRQAKPVLAWPGQADLACNLSGLKDNVRKWFVI